MDNIITVDFVKIKMSRFLLSCFLSVVFLPINYATVLTSDELHAAYGDDMAAMVCAFFPERSDCKIERSRTDPITDATRNVLEKARLKLCTPYDCTDEPKIAPVNLCIAIQKSCTVNSDDLTRAYNHAKGLIKTIDNAAMISTVVYSDEANVQNKIQRLPNTTMRYLNKLLKKFSPPKYKKDKPCEDKQAITEDAIQKCWDEFNKTDNKLQDVMIIYTNGVSFKTSAGDVRDQTIEKAQENRAKKIQTFVIKYKNPSDSIDGDDEWNALNNPSVLEDLPHPKPLSLTRKLKVPTFLTDDACEAIPDCTKKPVPCGEIDLVFIVDRSNSTTVGNINRTLTFLSTLVKNLQFGGKQIRIGIITYNQKVTVHLSVNETLNNDEILARIDEIPTSNAMGAHTHEALAKARGMLKGSGRKDSARQVIVMMSNGQTWLMKDNIGGHEAKQNSALTIEQAKLAKEEGDEIFVIGLPGKDDSEENGKSEWISISSVPHECHFIDMTGPDATFEDLKYARFHILTHLCIFDEGECQYAQHEEDSDIENENNGAEK
ncbi:unnamed protein product [Owenia fusiformis]|uniref:VWFA domain-containing protein n=1 Tax=Owenia fusiformis TaxID=6347 RepID=A0A8S4NCU1_OWEFU|nr:unnamed protein product [Owenia fusiformis]